MMRCLAAAAALAIAACASHTPAAQAKRHDPVTRTLSRLATGDTYATGEVAAWRRDWRAARTGVRHLDGSEGEAVQGVIDNTRSLARRHMLGGRARSAFLTLRRNLAWFVEQRRPMPPSGSRRGFGTEIVWQIYPGSGWQLQPLATFGRLNWLARSRRSAVRVRAVLDDLLPLGVSRRGFLAFEYLFPWGGRPGWVSGMAQATGMQALARAADRLGDPRLMRIAARMRGAFETPPPWGVRRRTGRGRAHYLQYSHLPRMLVGNGFAQTLIGLDEYRERSGDPRAARLVEQGLAQARRNMPRFDTGAWSLYSRTPSGPGVESDLHYHRLFETFLGQLCDRVGEEEFCRLRDRFARYESEPVDITALRARAARRRLTVTLRVSKRSQVSVTVRSHGRRLAAASRSLLRGQERFTFTLPRRSRADIVDVEATSLTAVRSRAAATVRRR